MAKEQRVNIVQFRVPPELLTEFDGLAKGQGVSLAEWLRESAMRQRDIQLGACPYCHGKSGRSDPGAAHQAEDGDPPKPPKVQPDRFTARQWLAMLDHSDATDEYRVLAKRWIDSFEPEDLDDERTLDGWHQMYERSFSEQRVA